MKQNETLPTPGK